MNAALKTLVFDYPQAWRFGLPLILLVVLAAAWSQKRRGAGIQPILLLTSLRAAALGILLFLLAQPVWVATDPPANARRPVVLLMDRSASMSLKESEKTRYEQALVFARDHLLPALNDSGFPVKAYLFAHESEPVDGPGLARAPVDGKRTNLGGAIARALADAPEPPLALIALTDGVANENADNTRALSSLMGARVPLVAVGVGSDSGIQTLSLLNVYTPAAVAPNTSFHVSAQLELVNAEALPPFDLVLFRDGKMIQKKTIQAGHGSRYWVESFSVTEAGLGVHTYAVQLLPPAAPQLKCLNAMGRGSVQIVSEKELRILYVQGSLTWDYKFISLALRNDPSIKLTGLTRTSAQSIFRQNVESAGELVRGFPTTLEELAPFRVVVLSNLKPNELTPAQEELLARFCGELGGGMLMIGGSATFNSTWQGSRLEQLLPVVFAANPGVLGLDQPFRMELADEALQHPVFQIVDGRAAREVWAELPSFTQYGRVDAAKPGAHIWARHPSDDGPKGRRILMAWQRYGSGRSAVLCLQNFWRWRLAKETQTQQFDRFWQQFFRFLSESSRQQVTIHLADQDLHPDMDVRLVLEAMPQPNQTTNASIRCLVKVDSEGSARLAEQSLELAPGRPVDWSFHAPTAGLYNVTVLDANKQPLANRPIEIRDINLEFQNTARDMETLRQWASVSGGLALKVEDCRDPRELVADIKRRIEEARQRQPWRQPMGVNAGMLALVLSALAAEWILRKHWQWV